MYSYSLISFGTFALGLISAVLIFLTALAWNEAIVASIVNDTVDNDGDTLTGKWIYAVVALIVLFLAFWLFAFFSRKDAQRQEHGHQGQKEHCRDECDGVEKLDMSGMY